MKTLKKMTSLFAGLYLTFGFFAYGSSPSGQTGSALRQPQGESAGKTLVVYFSVTDTTENIAKKIAAITDADMYEIIPVQPYSGNDLNYSDNTSRTSVEMNNPNTRPAIGSESISLDEYQVIYLGYPIWWGEAPRIMSTFAESYDFTGKTVIPFCTSGGSGIGNSDDDLKRQAGSGRWIDGRRFNGNVSQEEIRRWIEDLK